MVPRGRYLPEKEQTSRAEVDKERGEGKVLPKYLLCFKFCASPFHIYYFTYTKKNNNNPTEYYLHFTKEETGI